MVLKAGMAELIHGTSATQDATLIGIDQKRIHMPWESTGQGQPPSREDHPLAVGAHESEHDAECQSVGQGSTGPDDWPR